MPTFEKIGDARKALEAEQRAARDKAAQQQDALRRGYHSTGWESVAPSTRSRVADHPATSGAPAPTPGKTNRLTGEADTDEVRKRAREGRVIDNSVLGR
jgi:hypothetical protein